MKLPKRYNKQKVSNPRNFTLKLIAVSVPLQGSAEVQHAICSIYGFTQCRSWM